jgi:hypothetical protein
MRIKLLSSSVYFLRLSFFWFSSMRAYSADSAADQEYFEEIGKASKVIYAEINGKTLAERINILQRFMSDYRDNPPVFDMLLQLIGTEYSFSGQHLLALQSFDLRPVAPPPAIDELQGLSAKSATEIILARAQTSQILMINEAHHVPQHRVLTFELLPSLWEKGFRYFAVEALAPAGEGLMAEGHLSKMLGYYTQEPIFVNLLLRAKELGFKLISYDASGSSVDERERAAANNIRDKIFINDPEAKVVVHAGYGHIREEGWLAFYLKEELDIDPVTVDQTKIAEKGQVGSESGAYGRIVDNFNFNEPVVLLDHDGAPWSSNKESFDISVIWPRTLYEFGRPTWAQLGRKTFPVNTDWCYDQFPCTVEVFRLADDEVPLDRMVLTAATEQVSVFLSSQQNFIVVTNMNGTRLHTEEISL